MPEDKLPIPQFAAKIKAKYPEYKDMDDTLLVNKIVAKYPEYNSQVDMGNEQPLLKKKETTTPTSNDGGLLGGVTQSTYNPQLKSEKEGFKDAGIFGKRKAEERNPFYLADEYKDLIGKKKTISTGGGSSFGLGTTGFQEVQDDEAKAKADKIEMDLLKRGYNVKKLVKDTEGLPKEFFDNDNTSKEALFGLMKQNPIKYNDIVNSAKTVYAIAKQSDAATANQFNHLNNIQYGGLENFIEGKRDQQAIIDRTLVGNEREEAHNRLMENSSKFINAANPDLIKEYQQSPLSAKVDINQYAGLKTLEIFKPEQYQQAIDFLGKDLMNLKTANPSMDLSGVMNTSLGTNGNVKSIAIGVNEKLGKESLLRQLSDLGRNNAITGLTKDQYELNSAFEQAATPEEQEQIKQQYVQNQSQINSIREEAKNDKSKFPLTEKLKLDKLAKEVTQQPGVGVAGYAGFKFAKGFENTGNSFEDIVTGLFGSKDDKTTLQMRRLGEMQNWENDLYLPESLKTEQSPYILQASKPLKDKVKTFLNGRSIGDLSREEKDKLNKIVSDNESEIETITNPELGKSKNFLTKATMYQNAGFLGDIGSLVAQTYGLGALGAGRLVTTMTPMFTTSYSDYFNQAVAEGKPMNKASEYAFTHASIMALAGLINPKLDVVKRAVGINTAAGKLLANISEDSWKEITSKGSKWINKFKDAGTGVAKEAAKMTAVYGVGTSIANDLADKALFDKNISADEMAEHAVTAGKDMLFGSAGLLGINFLTHTIKGKKISPLEKASLWDLGDNPDLGHLKIDEAVAKGDITKEQGEQRKAAITEVSSLIDKIPRLNKEGKPMTDAQRADYLYNEFVKTKAKEVKKDLPKAQVQEVEQKELEADHANNIIYTDLSLSELEKRQSKIEKELEPKKDADGKVIELPEKEANDLKAELVAVKEAIQNKPKESNVVGEPENISQPIELSVDSGDKLTKEAEDLITSVGEGSMPTFITKNLEKIAADNGIEIKGDMTAVDVVNALKEKQQSLSPNKEQTPSSVGGEVKAEEPVLPKGRTPVTISGATESERQQSIEQRKKEEKQTPMTKDRDIILERIRKFNTLTRPQRRNASYEENSIRLAVDSFNEKHGKKHSFGKNSNGFLVLRGEPSAKKSYGTTISTALKGGERGIVDNGKALHERGDKVKEVFNDLLENNVLPIGRRVNGEKMSEAEFDGTIQDIMDGIPSLRAENYLNSLERQIAEDSFDYGNPDKNAAPTTLKEALGIEQEIGEPMSVEKMEEWLKNESDITPEEQQTFDNIENLVTFYEQRNEEGTTGKISEPSQKPTTSDSGEIKQNSEVKEQPTNTKEQVVTPIESKQKDLSLQDKTKNNANNIINGKAVFERFSPQEQRGFTEGGTRNVEASLLLATSEGTSGKDNSTPEAQENRIEQYAKDERIWVDNTTEHFTGKHGEPIGAGEEAIVWYDEKKGKVIKTQDTFQYDNLQQKLDGITLHNAYFPEAAIKVIGFGRNANGDFQVIVEQPFIQGEKLTLPEIKTYLENAGFKEDENGHFSNGDTIIEDLHTGNVIKDADGNIIVIDPIMRLNTPEQGYGGVRKLSNKVSEITPIESKSSTPPPTTPPTNKITVEGEGKDVAELDKMTSSIPNDGEVKKYLSGDTMKKYGQGDPRNPQEITAQELRPALQHGIDVIEKSKELFGDKYIEKTIEYLDSKELKPENKALLYVSLENEIAHKILESPDDLGLKKLQDLVRTKSQAYLRSNSLAINMGRLRRFADAGYDISKVTEDFFSDKQREERRTVEKLVEADSDTINDEALKQEVGGIDELVESKIKEGVEKEINKIYEQLPKDKKTKVDKAIEALEKFQKTYKGKTYDATIGVPIAILDAGINTIKLALKAGVEVANAIELGIEKIKEIYGKGWKENDFRDDMSKYFKKEEKGINPTEFTKNALIQNGFGRTVNVKTKNGVEKREILDWKKLAGEEGSIDKISENVAKSLAPLAMSEKEIADMSKSFIDEYNNIRASVIEKGLNEIANRNKKQVSPEQKSAAKKLAEMYNYGLFDKDLAEYEVALAKTIGVGKLNETNVKNAVELGDAMSKLYNTTFQNKRLNERQMRSGIQVIENKMREILADEAGVEGNFYLKAADFTRTYFDLAQRMTLNNLGQAMQNPLSGKFEDVFSHLGYGKNIPKELRIQIKKSSYKLYKEMVLEKGVGYGNVSTTFVNRGNLEMILDRTDSKMFHAIASTLIGKTTLDAVDSLYKLKITQQKFAYNLINILTKDRLINGKIEKGMSKDEAKKYVAEKLTGQSFKEAKTTAKKIIDDINLSASKKRVEEAKKSGIKDEKELKKIADKQIFNDGDTFVNRLADDIVTAALVNGEKISEEMVTAAYNSAYKAAGRGLGHVANNIISDQVGTVSGKIENQINEAIKNKEYNKAASLKLISIFFRNIANPFVGGGTNWVVLKAEKAGLGLFSGLGSLTMHKKMDLTSESGIRDLEKSMYSHLKIKDKFIRGAIGGGMSLLTTGMFLALTNTDDYRKWRKNNMWAAKYLDNITPEATLVKIAKEDKQLKRYLSSAVNKNESFDKGLMALKAMEAIFSGDSKKAWVESGRLAGSSIGAPAPWRLVRDIGQFWTGATGGDPYKINNASPETFAEAYFKGGLIDYLGLAPHGSKSYTDEQTKSPKLKFIFDKGLELPQDPNKATVSPKIVVDDKHPKGEFTEDEYDYFKKERAKLIVEQIGKKVDNQETKFVNRKDDEGNSTFRGRVKFNELDPDLLKKELSNIAGDATDEAKKKTIEKFNIKVSKAQ